jgi:uncharacterized membrane protein YGL010W
LPAKTDIILPLISLLRNLCSQAFALAPLFVWFELLFLLG